MYMQPLPSKPDFPVYGLDREFEGLRWLTVWQRPRKLYSVTLGHGRPEDGPWVAVETVLKTPETPVGQKGASSGPTGFQDAVLNAVIRLAELQQATRGETNAMLSDQIAQFGSDIEVDQPTVLRGWHSENLIVDGTAHKAFARHLCAGWAIVVDLPAVSVSVTGPPNMSEAARTIVDVSAILSEYI